MVQFGPADHFDDETPAADSRGEAPVAAPRRRSRRLAAPSFAPTNPLLEQAFPSWARPPKQPAVGADAGFEAAFRAGAGLALLDQILRADPPFAGALRQRLALRAATACAALARHREDSSALRDAEHLSPNAGGNAPTSPGRAHPSAVARFRRAPGGVRRRQICAGPPICSNCRGDLDFEALAEALRRLFQGEENPLAAAARAGSTTTRMLDGAPRAETEILALWLSDLMLARKLGWDAPIALLATTIARPSSRSAAPRSARARATPIGRSIAPRPYALAAREAHGLAARSFSPIGEGC